MPDSADEQSTMLLQVGLGKAGTTLHGSVWDNLQDHNVTRIGYDADPEKRLLARATGMIVVDSLAELPDALAGRQLDIVDNTTASGQHAASTSAVLEVLEENGISPTAWLFEKPLVSNDQEKSDMEAMLAAIAENNPDAGIFVNENYQALLGLAEARQIIAEQQAKGNDTTDILVKIVKDRVLDVMDGRQTDAKGLGAFGIEAPHLLAVARYLLGEDLDVRPQSEGGSIRQNDYVRNIDLIAESEGSLTVFEQEVGGVLKTVTMQQALGPFDYDENNQLVRREYGWGGADAERYATVTFQDGSTLKLHFDPIAGEKRYNSKIEFTPAEGNDTAVRNEVFEDNSLRRVIGSVAAFAASGGREKPEALEVLGPRDGLVYYDQLNALRSDAGTTKRIGMFTIANLPAMLDYEVAIQDALYVRQEARAKQKTQAA